MHNLLNVIALLMSMHFSQGLEPKNYSALEEIVTKTRQLEPDLQHKIAILYLISKPVCAPCLSELNYAWKTMPAELASAIRLRIVTDGLSQKDLESFGVDVIQCSDMHFEEDIQNFVVVADTNGHIITSYHVGSSNGFEPAYQRIDSILLARSLITARDLFASSRDLANGDTAFIPASFNADIRNPLTSRFRYDGDHHCIELMDFTKPNVLCIDTNGKLTYQAILTASTKSESSKTKSYSLFQSGFLTNDRKVLASRVQFLAPVDTIVYGKHAQMFKHSRLEITSPWRAHQDSLLVLKDVCHFTTASDDGRHLWCVNDIPGISPDSMMILHINASTFSIDTIRLPLKAKIQLFNMTACGSYAYILTNDGLLIRIDTNGTVKYQQATCKLPGYRVRTYACGSFLGAIQNINGVRYVVFFDTDGRRVSEPYKISPEGEYVMLLDSGNLITLVEDSASQAIHFCRWRIN